MCDRRDIARKIHEPTDTVSITEDVGSTPLQDENDDMELDTPDAQHQVLAADTMSQTILHLNEEGVLLVTPRTTPDNIEEMDVDSVNMAPIRGPHGRQTSRFLTFPEEMEVVNLSSASTSTSNEILDSGMEVAESSVEDQHRFNGSTPKRVRDQDSPSPDSVTPTQRSPIRKVSRMEAKEESLPSVSVSPRPPKSPSRTPKRKLDEQLPRGKRPRKSQPQQHLSTDSYITYANFRQALETAGINHPDGAPWSKDQFETVTSSASKAQHPFVRESGGFHEDTSNVGDKTQTEFVTQVQRDRIQRDLILPLTLTTPVTSDLEF